MNDKPTRRTVDDVYRMQWIGWLIMVLLVVAAAYAGITLPPLPPMPAVADVPSDDDPLIGSRGTTNLDTLVLDGDLTVGDDLTVTDDVSIGGDIALSAGSARIAAPTAVATATPALVVDNAGVSQVASFRDGGTELLGIIDGGQVRVVAPTAVATAVPAFVVDSAGVSNLAELRAAATPVFSVSKAGVVTGNVLQFSTSGSRAISWTDDITGTATVAHGLATVTWALCTLGEDPTAGAGDAAHVSVAISENVVTAKAWQDDFVTEATETDVTVHCLVIGTP